MGRFDYFFDNVDKLDTIYEQLPRLQLYTKGSTIDRGLVKSGQYGIPTTGDRITVLGKTVDVYVFARRPKALDMTGKEALIVSYDADSDEFKRIIKLASQLESGCMYGVSFLVYEPTTRLFLEFYCGSRSSRTEAKKIYPFLPVTTDEIEDRGLNGVVPHGALPMTLKSKRVESGNFSWHVPVVTACRARSLGLIEPELIEREVASFLAV